MVYEHGSYHGILREAFQERLKRNPRFSLRSFAQLLQMSPSGLSEVLNGKKKLSIAKALGLAERLHLKGREREYFLSLVQIDFAKTLEEKSFIQHQLRRLNPHKLSFDHDIDAFQVISEWYHLPILEFTDVSDVDLSPRNVAKSIGITLREAEAGIERLLRMGLLERSKSGKLRKTKQSFVFRSSTPNSALRHYHRQMLAKIDTSLETQTPEQKFSGTETFAFDPKDIDKAKEVIEQCIDDLAALALKGKKRNTLYHLNIHFFNLLNSKSEDS